MKYVRKEIEKHELDSFSFIFRKLIEKWLNDGKSDWFYIEDEKYQLLWNGCTHSYEVWLDGELLAWNKNAEDFLNIGAQIYFNKNLYINIKNQLDCINFKFTKSFQQWNCEQLRGWNGEDYPNH